MFHFKVSILRPEAENTIYILALLCSCWICTESAATLLRRPNQVLGLRLVLARNSKAAAQQNRELVVVRRRRRRLRRRQGGAGGGCRRRRRRAKAGQACRSGQIPDYVWPDCSRSLEATNETSSMHHHSMARLLRNNIDIDSDSSRKTFPARQQPMY